MCTYSVPAVDLFLARQLQFSRPSYTHRRAGFCHKLQTSSHAFSSLSLEAEKERPMFIHGGRDDKKEFGLGPPVSA